MEMSGYVASHIKERGLLNFKLVVVAPERITGERRLEALKR